MSHATHSDHRQSYYAVWAALIILTLITVATAQIDLSHIHHSMNIIVAMIIATFKACLVGYYFMHLKYDNLLNKTVFLSSFVFLAIFVALTASDLFFRPADSAIKPVVVEAQH